jgi:hypothetical protein
MYQVNARAGSMKESLRRRAFWFFRSTRRPALAPPSDRGVHPTTNIIRKGKAMKALSFVLLLMASMAFVLGGCSDNSAVPVSPTDQSAAPASLQKSNDVAVDFSMNSQKVFVGGKMWENGGKLLVKKFQVLEPVASLDARVAGQMENHLSLTVDLITGEGPCHGSFTLDPDAADGVWEGTYEGYRSKTDIPYIFSLPLKCVAHGKGGAIDKMQLFIDITLTVYTDLPFVPGFVRPDIPLQAPVHWTGTGVGTIKEH